ncbi:MAG: 50S ribosomal protein L6 [Gammaproteobacteria bacterium]|jgi:large subunit ribosomal protein L6|nr:50S ribosomal protein L6 [Gammaproteobacteria bacterium]
MSRVAKRPVELPKGVEVTTSDSAVKVKGPKGELQLTIHPQVEVHVGDGKAQISARSAGRVPNAVAGTTRALLANMVTGVTKGFERKLELVGVGYRAQAQGRKLNLTLGFSHPVAYPVPDGITVETPSQTEIVVKGIDRQKVGQVAAEIRGYRAPEPYKGKGVRYSGEKVVLKEAKKK